MVTDPFLVGVFFGFVPAMGFLYILLHEYQAFFSEKRVFRVFLVGLVVGIVITLLEQFISPAVLPLLVADVADPRAAFVLLVFAALLGLMEALAFTVVLNSRKFRARRDTPFYATAFGIGFGGTSVLVLMALILASQRAAGFNVVTWVDAVLLAMLGLFFIGGILVHATMGVWIGTGTGTGPLLPFVSRAALLRAVYVAAFYGLLTLESAWASHLLAFAGIVLGVALVARVILPRLDRVVPPEVLREIEIHNRRLARRVRREPGHEKP